MSVSKRLRFEILRRDNHACRYCGAASPDAKLTVDHVIPQALGGSDEPANLVTACEPCNSGKSATPADAAIVDDVAADALRWSKAMAKALDLAKVPLQNHTGVRQWFRDEIWNNWTYLHNGERKTVALPLGWEDAIDRFSDLGLDDEEFTEAVRIAMTRKTRDEFKYMCGVLWNMVSERQKIAMEIVQAESAAIPAAGARSTEGGNDDLDYVAPPFCRFCRTPHPVAENCLR